MVVQTFKINFVNHEHKLSEEMVGQCIISGQYYIGDVEIEEVSL